jgi:hypothetical protein
MQTHAYINIRDIQSVSTPFWINLIQNHEFIFLDIVNNLKNTQCTTKIRRHRRVRSEKMRHKLKMFTKFQTSLFNFWGVLFDCMYIEVCKSKLAIKKKPKNWKKYSLLSIDINQQNLELEHIFQHFLKFILYKKKNHAIFLVKIMTGTITTDLAYIMFLSWLFSK